MESHSQGLMPNGKVDVETVAKQIMKEADIQIRVAAGLNVKVTIVPGLKIRRNELEYAVWIVYN